MSDPSEDIGVLLRALRYAADRHRDQRRKDDSATPYINHLLCVVNLLWEVGGVRDAATLAAAALHDTVEDTATTPAEVEAAFGRAVHAIVAEVTDDKSLPKEERKRRQIERAGGASYAARLVKLADKICNLQDLANTPPVGWSLDRQREYVDWSSQVIDALRGTHPALEDAFDEAAAAARRKLS